MNASIGNSEIFLALHKLQHYFELKWKWTELAASALDLQFTVSSMAELEAQNLHANPTISLTGICAFNFKSVSQNGVNEASQNAEPIS
jgi:hypothetical protein